MGRFGFRSCVDDFTRVYIPERNGARTSTIFHDLNPQAAFLMNWHIEVIAAKRRVGSELDFRDPRITHRDLPAEP
jgi:hypothetical protein